MSDRNVARRYAEALIDVAAEQSAVDRIGADLVGFVGLLDLHGGVLRSALCTPVFAGEERRSVLEALLPRLGMHAVTGNFLRVLEAKGRTAAIDQIALAYADLANERAGRVVVQVVSAAPLDAGMRDQLRALLARTTGREVVLEPAVDADLIGGMVVRVGGTVYDSSIRTRLQQVRRALLDAQAPALAK